MSVLYAGNLENAIIAGVQDNLPTSGSIKKIICSVRGRIASHHATADKTALTHTHTHTHTHDQLLHLDQ